MVLPLHFFHDLSLLNLANIFLENYSIIYLTSAATLIQTESLITVQLSLQN